MSATPIFVATHPRSCSTAFERVFMTRDDLACRHEPFGDAFYYGPERLSARFADDPATRSSSGYDRTTYKDVLERCLDGGDKRVFIKDMAYYLYPADGQPAATASSVAGEGTGIENGTGTGTGTGATVLPASVLRRFHFAFLIRHPRRSIPSYYRCTVPPLVDTTLFHQFMPSEAGYAELRRLFDYLRAKGLVGTTQADGQAGTPQANGQANGQVNGSPIPITVIDADDLLDRPAEGIQAFCRNVGLEYTPDMLQWNDEVNQHNASVAFEKWAGFHNDALESTGLKARTSRRKTPTTEEEDEEWRAKFGEEGQKVIRDCVEANVADYEYLKSFALKF